MKQGIIALKWMTRGWSLNSISELILKLFYSYGIDSDAFVQAIHLFVAGWEKEKVVELLSVLLIGERAQGIARFIGKWMLESNWTRDTLAFLVTCLAKGLRWNMDYSRDFLLELLSEIGLDRISRDNLMRIVTSEFVASRIEPLGLRNLREQHLDSFILLFELIVHEKRLDMIINP
jgi:hypothetical protein